LSDTKLAGIGTTCFPPPEWGYAGVHQGPLVPNHVSKSARGRKAPESTPDCRAR